MTPLPAARPKPSDAKPTSTASLLYWLLVICGLAGITMQRLDALNDVIPLWVGTIVGLGVGQLVAWARIRVWVLAALGMTALWLSPLFFIVFYRGFGSSAQTCAYALMPAAICGYLSLSERGALVAFWYPAVLWMLVILDTPSASMFAASPLVIGLAALFVAYLRARETRRVALWRGDAAVRLATPVSHTVLRASPLRAASQHAWTGIAGAGALVLAAWIAPHLWQTEQAKHTQAHGTDADTVGTGGAQRCCSQGAMLDTKRVRVREYLPLVHGHDEDQGLSSSSPRPSCTVCQDGETEQTASTNDYDGLGTGTMGGSGHSTDTSPPQYAYGGQPSSLTGSSYPSYPAYPPTPPVSPSLASSPDEPLPAAAPIASAPVTAKAAIRAAPAPKAGVAPAPAVGPAAPVAATRGARTSGAPPSVIALQPAATPPAIAVAPPWQAVLLTCLGALLLRAFVRVVRRKLTLRHLARPFWPETLDQRISNHWERVLIGLRDAGIHASADEQPEALAKRVGIAGMETCATILERVRHGVRVEREDLAAMDAAAGAVFRAAQETAGLTGRAAALVRWPLA